MSPRTMKVLGALALQFVALTSAKHCRHKPGASAAAAAAAAAISAPAGISNPSSSSIPVVISASTSAATSAAAPVTLVTSVSSAPSVPSPTPATSAAASPSGASAASPVSGETLYGPGTWYGETCGEEGCWQKGPCAFVDYVLPPTIDGSTCVSELIWDDAYQCGGCVAITYKGQKKIAMITNKTGGNATHLDMSPDMFSKLADKNLGEIPLAWEHVPCPIATPLAIRMHGGSSQWWFAATVENAVYRTAKMEVSADQGATWKPTTRDTNNFFKLVGNGGTGSQTAWIRVTSETGSQVVLKDVPMKSDSTTTATENYA